MVIVPTQAFCNGISWGGEFGRLPVAQKSARPGRDHNSHAFTSYNGRDFRLTDVAGRVIKPILA